MRQVYLALIETVWLVHIQILGTRQMESKDKYATGLANYVIPSC